MKYCRPIFLKSRIKPTSSKYMQSIIRLTLSLLLIVCVVNLGYSQKKNKKKKKSTSTSTRAIVQYNDGSVFIGNIIFEGTLDMKMVISTNDTVHLNKAYIKRIKRGDKNISLFSGAKFHYTEGFFASLQFGSNTSDFDNQTNEITVIGGYRFNKKLAAGVGFGAGYNTTFSFGTWIDASTIPVFAYARYYPIDKRVKPYIAGSLGYGFRDRNAFGANHSGGLYFEPEIGVNFSSRRRIRFTLSIGQQVQHIKGSNLNFDQFGNTITSNFNLWFNRTVLKIGLDWK